MSSPPDEQAHAAQWQIQWKMNPRTFCEPPTVLALQSNPQPLLLHQCSDPGSTRICALPERSDDRRLILRSAILADLELGFDPAGNHLKAYNVFQHSMAKLVAQVAPLREISRIECIDDFAYLLQQVFRIGNCASGSINMHRSIIPRGNALPTLIQAGRNISMRTMKDSQRLLVIFQKTAVRIRLGHVSMQNHLIAHFPHENGDVSRERTIVRRRNQNGERIRPHESDRIRVLANPVKFGDVHASVLL